GSVATWQAGAPSWSTLADSMTTPRDEHASATIGGKIYLLGGESGPAAGEIDAFEYYQPGTAGWHTLQAMPTARKMFAAAVIGSRLYGFGGSRWNSAGIRFTNVVEVYDTATPGWSQVASMPTGRFEHAAVELGGKIYVIGGEREDTDATTATVD